MSAKKRHRTIDFLNYLKGKSTMQERHELEQELEADPFAKEAMEGLEGLDPEQVEKDVLALHGKLRKRLSRRKRIRWYSVAATAASILIVGTIFLQIYDSDPAPEDLQPDVFLEERQEEAASEPAEEPAPLEKTREKAPPEMAQVEKVPPEQELTQEPAQEPAPKRESPKEKKSPALAADQAPEPVPEPIAHVEALEEVDVEADAEADTEAGATYQAAPEMARSRKGKRSALDIVMVSEAASADEAALEESFDLSAGMVSGVVLYSEDMQALPGANILVKDADTGISADMLGRFSLPVMPDTLHTLLASFVGMEESEFSVRDGEHVKLVLHPDPSTGDKTVLAQGGSDAYFNELYRSAEPEDGFKSFSRYIKKHLRYPEPSPGDPQVVILSFKLTAEGDMTEFIPIRSPGPAFTAEAIRLLSEGPAWKPAAYPAGPVDEVVSIRILFEQ